MANIPRLTAVLIHDATQSAWTALSRGILAIYHKPPEVPYCYYKLANNVIRVLKIMFCHTCGIYTTAISQSAFRVRTTQFIM